MSTLINFRWRLCVILKNGFRVFYRKLLICIIDKKVNFNKMESCCSSCSSIIVLLFTTRIIFGFKFLGLLSQTFEHFVEFSKIQMFKCYSVSRVKILVAGYPWSRALSGCFVNCHWLLSLPGANHLTKKENTQ